MTVFGKMATIEKTGKQPQANDTQSVVASEAKEREVSSISNGAVKEVSNSEEEEVPKDKADNNNVSSSKQTPTLDHKVVAPGSARKTGRPVGKQYVEHLLAHMKQQGQTLSEQNKQVLQVGKEGPVPTEADKEKKSEGSEAAKTNNDAPKNVNTGVRTLVQGGSGTLPVLLLVSSESTPTTRQQTLILATVSPQSSCSNTAVVTTSSSANSTPKLPSNTFVSKADTDKVASTEPLEGKDPKNQEKTPAGPPLVDQRLAALQQSESESATSQSENEGGEEVKEKPKKGRKKKRRTEDHNNVQTSKDCEPVKIISRPEEGEKKKPATTMLSRNQVEVVAVVHAESPPQITDDTKPDTSEPLMASESKDDAIDTTKPPTLLPEGDTSGIILDGRENLRPDLDIAKEVESGQQSADDGSKVQEGGTDNQTKEPVVAQQPISMKLTDRPKRKIKHKFLEDSDRYESAGKMARGRGRGRVKGMRGLGVRRGSSRGGGLVGRGRGRGMGRTRGGKLKPRSKIRGRGRWTRRKGSTGKKAFQKMEQSDLSYQSDGVGLAPLVMDISGNHIPGASPALESKSPLKIIRRGGFRGSRRRGYAARGGYKNVAKRGRGGIAQPLSREIPEAVVLEVDSPIPTGIHKDSKTKELGPVSNSDVEGLQETAAEKNMVSDVTVALPPDKAVRQSVEDGDLQAIRQTLDTSGYIPYACLRGKARKTARPRSNTHFGQHRKRRMGFKQKRAYDSDWTDQNSEGSMAPPSSKRLQRSNSNSTFASGDSEDDLESQTSTATTDATNTTSATHSTTHTGRMAPPAPPTPCKTSFGDHNYGREPPLCCCMLVQNKPITAIANVCEALEIVNGKVATCTRKVDEQKVMRPSSRIPFRGFCFRHRKKMMEHRCCPGCGCFCTTGPTMVCSIDSLDHYFHKDCIREIDQALYCPHCGEDANISKEVVLPDLPNLSKLSILPESVLLSHERIRLPKALLSSLTGLKGLELMEALENHKEKTAYIPKAKMIGKCASSPGRSASPVMPETPPHQDDSIFKLQLKNGKTITSGILPQGPSRESLEMAMKFMDPENPRRLRFAPKNLYMASSLGEIEKVLQMLGEGFDPNYHFPSHNRETPVHAAAANGHLDIVCMLVQAGANIDAEDEDHRTPLHLAVDKEQFECVKFLCRHGARPDHVDDDGTAVAHIATMKGNREIMSYLLKLKRVHIDVQDNGGWTPIIWAADNKNNDMVSFLLSHGADPTIRDKEQNIALHWASYSGSQKVMEELMNHDTFQESIVNTVNIHGDTPLHVAARENNLGCVTQLLMRKADVTICNKEGETPLDCAVNKSDVWMAMEANLRINIYVQKRNLRTERILSRDICRGRENIPIPVINSIDDQPLPKNFLYVADNCETSPLDIDRSIKPMQGCRCENDCSTDSCPCGQSSVRCWYSPEGQLAEDFNYQEPPLIFECGRACNCWQTCRNRVVQNGIKAHLQLFRTPMMGWGVRTTHDIPKGTFICQYAGELISDAEADKREDDSYLFDLENREGDVYCIDARFYGNISRFINHLCEPNIVPVRVFIEHYDLRFPHIAFFASRQIKAFEELGFDYGDKFWTIKSKYFTCNCRSRLCKHSTTK